MQSDRDAPTLRCALCHDGLGAERHRCSGCGTIVHPECQELARGCPTLGCHARGPSSAATARPPAPGWSRGAVVALLRVGLVGLVAGAAVVLLVQGGRRIARPDLGLYDSSSYEPVARRLALYCQSERRLVPELFLSAWIPAEVSRDFPRARGGASPWGAHIELGGGFLHYGYRLERDEAASSATENVWHLVIYHEWEPADRVYTLRIAPDERLPAAELLLLAELDARDPDWQSYR